MDALVEHIREIFDWLIEHTAPEHRAFLSGGLVWFVLGVLVVTVFNALRGQHLKNQQQSIRNRKEEEELKAYIREGNWFEVRQELTRAAFPDRLASVLAEKLAQRDATLIVGSDVGAPIEATYARLAASAKKEDRRALGYLVEGDNEAGLRDLQLTAEKGGTGDQGIEAWRRVAQIAYVRDIDAAINAYERLDELEPGNAQTALQLARLYERRGQSEQALSFAKQAMERAKSNPKDCADALTTLSSIQRRVGKSAEAQQSADRAVTFARALLDNKPESRIILSRALREQSINSRRQKNLEGATKAGEEAERLLADCSPGDSAVLREKSDAAWNLLSIYSDARQLDAAEHARRRMGAAAEEALKVDPSDVIAASLRFSASWWEAQLLLEIGDNAMARSAAQAANAAAAAVKSLDTKSRAWIDARYWALTIQARVESADGSSNVALALLRDAMNVAEQTMLLDRNSASDRFRSISINQELANALWATGDEPAALKELRGCVFRLRELVEREPSVEGRLLLVQCLGGCGQLECAVDAAAGLAHCEEAIRHAETLLKEGIQPDFEESLQFALAAHAAALSKIEESQRAREQMKRAVGLSRKIYDAMPAYPGAPIALANTLVDYCDILRKADARLDARTAVIEAVRLCEDARAHERSASDSRVYFLALDRLAEFTEAEEDLQTTLRLLERASALAEGFLKRDATNKTAQNDRAWALHRIRKVNVQMALKKGAGETER